MLTYTTMFLHLLLCATTSIFLPTTAFPTHFPPFHFATYINIDPANITANDVLLASDSRFSPAILLCQEPSFATSCVLFFYNTPNTCLNVMWENPPTSWNIALDVKSLKVGENAACALYEGTSCGGHFTTFDSIHSHDTTPELTHSVASFFCEPLDKFSTTDAAQGKDTPNVLKVAGSSSQTTIPSTRRKRHPKALADSPPPQPYAEAQHAGGSEPSLAPWKPSSNDWPHKASDGNCGDGPNNADGCMGPGKVVVGED